MKHTTYLAAILSLFLVGCATGEQWKAPESSTTSDETTAPKNESTSSSTALEPAETGECVPLTAATCEAFPFSPSCPFWGSCEQMVADNKIPVCELEYIACIEAIAPMLPAACDRASLACPDVCVGILGACRA
jgi:hypothetical protein